MIYVKIFLGSVLFLFFVIVVFFLWAKYDYDYDALEFEGFVVQKIVCDSVGNEFAYDSLNSGFQWSRYGFSIVTKLKYVPSIDERKVRLSVRRIGRNGFLDTNFHRNFSMNLGSKEVAHRVFVDSLSGFFPLSESAKNEVDKWRNCSFRDFLMLHTENNPLVDYDNFNKEKVSFWFSDQDSLFVKESFDKRLAVTF